MLSRRVLALSATFVLVGALLPLSVGIAVAAGPACTTTCYVNASTGNDANGGASAGDAKLTIQAAVTQVSAGGTVIVAAGTYTEAVTVNKSIDLEGAQAGVDARTRSGAESIVAGPNGETAFNLTASGVTVDGFTVQDATNANQFGYGIVMGAGTSGGQILNNIIQNNIAGLALSNASAASPALVQHNLFQNNDQPGAGSGNDIYADQFTAGGIVTGATIDANTFTNTALVADTWAIGISNTAAAQFTGLMISNNTITNHGRGMYFYGTTSSTISDNTITGASHYAIGLFVNAPGTDSDSALTISGNTINGSSLGGEGLEAFDGSSGAVTQNLFSGTSLAVDVQNDPNVTTVPAITVNRNSIAGNTAGVSNTAGGTLDATCNWWGAASGPGPVGPGTGDTVTTNVTYTPWLTTSDLNGTCGAAPDLAITKSHVGNFHQGEVGATYKIVVSNRGSAPTTGTVTVTDNLPSGLTATGISGNGWTCSQPVGPCTRRNALAAGSHYAPLTLTVNVANDAPSSVTNSATVTGGGDPNGATATDPTTITSVTPDLTITKHHQGDFQQIGLGVYTIVVSNSGNGPTSGTVTVHDRMPFGLFGYAISGSGWTCTTASLTCTRSDALAGGASYPPITVNVAVAFSCRPQVVNVATVAGGGETNTSNDTARDPTNVKPFPIPF